MLKPSLSHELNIWNKTFSHIYIENAAREYPLTGKILSRYNESIAIDINHYRDVFNKPAQRFILQKNSPKLILAVKKDNFLYKGSPMCDNYGYEHFYYSSHVMNCIYNCEYCYLQGLYPSANIVIFVNINDYFAAVKDTAENNQIYLCLSYDTDLLAIENITGFIHSWAAILPELNSKNTEITLEVRTKSAAFNHMSDIVPNKNIILAWTLSPQEIIDRYEPKTPSLSERLTALCSAAERGWNTRICFDPILEADNWESLYKNALLKLFSKFPVNKKMDISVGAFRVSKEQFSRMKKNRQYSEILAGDFITNNDIVQYRNEDEIIGIIKNQIDILQSRIR